MSGAAVAVAVDDMGCLSIRPISISRLMGPTGSRTMTRLFAFLLLCIGVQILISGVVDVLGPLLAAR